MGDEFEEQKENEEERKQEGDEEEEEATRNHCSFNRFPKDSGIWAKFILVGSLPKEKEEVGENSKKRDGKLQIVGNVVILKKGGRGLTSTMIRVGEINWTGGIFSE